MSKEDMPMKSLLAAATLVLFLGAAAGRAADPITVDLWPGGKPPGQTVEPGPDTVNKNKGGKARLNNITRPQIVIYLPAKDKNTGAALIIAPGGGFKDLGWSFEGETMAEWCNKLGVAARRRLVASYGGVDALQKTTQSKEGFLNLFLEGSE
jgi:hypothetical protein